MSKARQRARQEGVIVGTLPHGVRNDITDVEGVCVGHSTIIQGEARHTPGSGPIRTGVTVILPHQGDLWNDRPSAGFFALNGCGEFTGAQWIDECGALEGPIALTNTHSVGDVARALTEWMIAKHPSIAREDEAYLPVVAECDDSTVNDLHGFHVRSDHVRSALEDAHTKKAVQEGAIGAGTGMTCYGFKGGIGSASRRIDLPESSLHVGVLVNTNHGQTEQLLIDGFPVGRFLKEKHNKHNKEGSIVIVIATDAPLNQRQLERLAKRACLGLARTGSIAANGSGDFALAFSTSRRIARYSKESIIQLAELHNDHLNLLFQATAEATEEAILNSIFMATTVEGRDGNTIHAFPIEECKAILNRLSKVQP